MTLEAAEPIKNTSSTLTEEPETDVPETINTLLVESGLLPNLPNKSAYKTMLAWHARQARKKGRDETQPNTKWPILPCGIIHDSERFTKYGVSLADQAAIISHLESLGVKCVKLANSNVYQAARNMSAFNIAIIRYIYALQENEKGERLGDTEIVHGINNFNTMWEQLLKSASNSDNGEIAAFAEKYLTSFITWSTANMDEKRKAIFNPNFINAFCALRSTLVKRKSSPQLLVEYTNARFIRVLELMCVNRESRSVPDDLYRACSELISSNNAKSRLKATADVVNRVKRSDERGGNILTTSLTAA